MGMRSSGRASDCCLVSLGSILVVTSFFFIVRFLRQEACYAIFSHLDLQLIKQLEPVEGSSFKNIGQSAQLIGKGCIE